MKYRRTLCLFELGFLVTAHAARLPENIRKLTIERLKNQVKTAREDAAAAGLSAEERKKLLAQRLAAIAPLRNALAQVGIASGKAPPDPEPVRRALVPAFEASRTDKQPGAGASSGGTTSLVSKGSIPSILGLAVENGALTRSVSGTSITFQGNPVGILRALSNKGFIEGFDADADVPFLRFARRVAFSTTFDASRGVANMPAGSTPVFTGDRQQLAAYSFHVDIVNRRDPRHPAYRPLWEKAAGESLQSVANSANQLVASVETLRRSRPDVTEWENRFRQALLKAEADDAQVSAAIDDALSQMEAQYPDLISALQPLTVAVNSYTADRNRILKTVANSTIVSFEFANTRQVDNPDLLGYRLIVETDLLKNGKSDFTLNALFNHFTDTKGLPAGAKRLRDYQFAAQLDVPVATNGVFENWLLTASWRYMRLLESQRIPLTNLTAPTGVINLAQLKFTVPVKDGVKIPLSVSWSNRTELVEEKEVRANFGLTFDLDTLFARLRP